MSRSSTRNRIAAFTPSVIFTTLFALVIAAQTQFNPKNLTWSTDCTPSARFVSVHGHRAAIFGYSQDGLEFWAYPFQIVSAYKADFHLRGTTTAIAGETLLRQITYNPESVTRTYVSPDFIIREHIFVPLDEPGAIIGYEVESKRPVDIDIHFVPVLNLMWPGGIGGQEALWDEADSAYSLSEPLHRFSGRIGSHEIATHDETPNRTRQPNREAGLGFTIRAGGDRPSARVIIAGGPERTAIEIAKRVEQNQSALEKLAIDHYSSFLNSVLQIETPDESINRALAWSEVALDQAWVCNPDLGCGLVAGYGPSRNARRPQYDWFFAGDGMVDLPALLAAGQFDRARQELEFILKYQDQTTGMIWHELSQSARWIEWSKYPYMFVHVELTFDFLNGVENYLSATGDRDFVIQHWAAIQSAYNYCHALLDSKDGLPHIPVGKEGSREQDPLSEELALSANWVTAAQAYANLATATGHNSEAMTAAAAARNAREVVARRYWDEKQNYWITGFTRSGAPLLDRRVGPLGILAEDIFSDAQRDSLLQQVASADFQADWGIRGRAATSGTYNPASYADGSVWATETASAAAAFWSEHRPAAAFQIWNALVRWNSLDSLGHMHETLTGDYYRQQLESVPEQTWSSATFFDAAVRGLLGLHVDARSNRLIFAPHLPARWDSLSLRHLHVGSSELHIQLTRSLTETRLEMHNDGPPVHIDFDPEIPFGAKLRATSFQGPSLTAALEPHSQDTHARVEFEVPRGDSLLAINYVGGIEITSRSEPLTVGDRSQGTKITNVGFQGDSFTVDFDHVPSVATVFEVRTGWNVKSVDRAQLAKISPQLYQLVVPSRDTATKAYEHGRIRIILAPPLVP